MTSNLRKSLIGAAVAAACAAPTLGWAAFTATNIQFDRDGTNASSAITISGIDWSQGTILAKGLLNSSNDGSGDPASHTANPNFVLYGQGAISKFSTPGGDIAMPKLTSAFEELTYQFAAPMTPLVFLADPVTIVSPPITLPALVGATLDTGVGAGATNFFKIWYSTGGGLTADNQATGDFSGVAESKQGTGFGGLGDETSACGPSTVGTEILVMCGVIVNDGADESKWAFSQAGTAFTKLDAAGNAIDNYDGVADGVTPVADGTAIGSVSGTGSGSLIVSVLYANSDFFKNTMFDKFVVDLKHTEASNLNFTNQTPHELVAAQTWDVGTDTGLVAPLDSRIINNLKCLNDSGAIESLTCDAVFEGDGGSTFQAYVVPEPGSLALLGLGLLGFGASVRRRKA